MVCFASTQIDSSKVKLLCFSNVTWDQVHQHCQQITVPSCQLLTMGHNQRGEMQQWGSAQAANTRALSASASKSCSNTFSCLYDAFHMLRIGISYMGVHQQPRIPLTTGCEMAIKLLCSYKGSRRKGLPCRKTLSLAWLWTWDFKFCVMMRFCDDIPIQWNWLWQQLWAHNSCGTYICLNVDICSRRQKQLGNTCCVQAYCCM